MYWLVENKEQLLVLKNSGYKEAFIEIIPYNFNEHPCNNHVSLVYIKPFGAGKGYMLCLHHSETFSLDKTLIDITLKSFETLYVRDKKEVLHYFPLKNLKTLVFPPNPFKPVLTQSHNIFYNRIGNNLEINTIIPIVKHYEYCENILKDIGEIGLELDNYTEFFNNKVSLVFNAIERNGIKVDKEKFEKHFHPIKGDYVFTKYNLHTLTTRPSNSFKGVNYAALNKNNRCREAFIPRNDKFIDIDISSYHPRLTCLLTGYDFGDIDFHKHMAELYGVSYEKSKELTFKQSYGGVFKKYKHLEYFQKMEEWIKERWKIFNEEEAYYCPISCFKFEKDKLENMNPQKLYNYILQNLETSYNVLILWDIIKILRGKKTKLVLYTYDSFLLDYDNDEEKVLKDIKNIFKKYQLNIKQKEGNNYNNLK